MKASDIHNADDARRYVGDSTVWGLGHDASVRKWEIIKSGENYRVIVDDEEDAFYCNFDSPGTTCYCGFCFVTINRYGYVDGCVSCDKCPVMDYCEDKPDNPDEVLQYLAENKARIYNLPREGK